MKNYKALIIDATRSKDGSRLIGDEKIDKILSLFREIVKEAKPKDVYTEDDALVAIDKYQSNVEKLLT